MSWVPSHEQMVASQLSRNDLVQLIQQPDIASQVMPGFFIRVLIELSTGTEDYRAYTIRRLVPGRQYSGFSNDRAAVTNLYLELNTNALLEADADAASGTPGSAHGTGSTSFQLNCISNSPITPTEYSLWVQEVARDPIRAEGVQGFNDRKSKAAQLMPTLTGPNVRRRAQTNSSSSNGNQQNSGENSNNNNNSNSNNQQRTGSPQANLNVTVRVGVDQQPAAASSSLQPSATVVNLAATAVGQVHNTPKPSSPSHGTPSSGGGGGGGNSSHHRSAGNRQQHGGGGGNGAGGAVGGDAVAQDAAPPSVALQEQLLASYKRNAVEDLREKNALFTDPRMFPTSKLVALRTLENDLGDYIEKVREVVQAKKPTCVVCMTKIPCVVFLPCRHMALCRSCAVDLVSAKCPLCRETIVELWEPEEL